MQAADGDAADLHWRRANRRLLEVRAALALLAKEAVANKLLGRALNGLIAEAVACYSGVRGDGVSRLGGWLGTLRAETSQNGRGNDEQFGRTGPGGLLIDETCDAL